MKSKAQGAMEYMATYGWALVAVLIIGVVLYGMGIFTPSAVTNFGNSGFGVVKPMEWLCNPGPGASDTVKMEVLNGAGNRIENLSIAVGQDRAICNSNSVGIGDSAICVIENVNCGAEIPGDRFMADISISYISQGTVPRSSAGSIWGSAE